MEYNVSLQTIAWINERNQAGTLEISPKFQRRPVWQEKERMELISTICFNLPFPEIYIQVVTDTMTGQQKHIVVDGQQRITSILKFIHGDISLPQSDDWNGQHLRSLDEEIQTVFWEYKIVVRNLSKTNDAEIRDIFARLNTNNFSLNDQELRNARYTGKFKSSAERLADNPFFQSIGLFTAREVRRMEDIEFVSELLLLTVEGITNKKEMLDEAYARYDEDFPRESQMEHEFNISINLVNSITTDDNQSFVKTKSNFYSIYGAILQFYRETKKTSFKDSDLVAAKLGELLADARKGGEKGQLSQEYFEAASRAASDKGRREKRQAIILDLLLSLNTK